jgi:hypothetical protein
MQPNVQQSQTVIIAGANGAGGIGKTELARKLVSELRAAYPDAQLFINLRGVAERPATSAEALQEFICKLEPARRATALPEAVSELRGIYLSLLSGRRALVVCDNARERSQVEPLIPPAGCALIVTSRSAIALPGIRACHLDRLAPDEAVRLLQSIVPHLSDAVAAQLAKLCGHFPQALRVYGNFLAERPNDPAQRYAARIAEAQARGELEPEIAAAFATSYEDLLDAAQQRHWRQPAVFVSDFDAEAAAAMWQLEGDDALETLSEVAWRAAVRGEMSCVLRLRRRFRPSASQFAQRGFVKTDDQLFSLAHDGTAQQIGIGHDQFKQFSPRRQRLGKAALFVKRMPRIQKRREVFVTENAFKFLSRQRLFGVIAFDEVRFAYVLAQETPRVATSRSSALEPAISFHRVIPKSCRRR